MTVLNIDADPTNARWLKDVLDDDKLKEFARSTSDDGGYTKADYKIYGKDPDKASISLIPEHPGDWTVEGGEEVKALHVTIKLLNDPNDFAEGDRRQIEDAVFGIVPSRPILAQVTGDDTLGPRSARVLLLESDSLVEFRDQLVAVLANVDADIPPDNYSTFLPHMTLSYGEADLEEFHGDVIVFNRVRISWGDRYREVRL